MTPRRCWTCNNDHDLDEACPKSASAVSAKAAGGKATDALFDDAQKTFTFGRIFMAQHESDDDCCGEGIQPGEDIRADGRGGWIHADDTCERLNRS